MPLAPIRQGPEGLNPLPVFLAWRDSPHVRQIRHMDKGFAGPLIRIVSSGTPNRGVFLVTGFEESALN